MSPLLVGFVPETVAVVPVAVGVATAEITIVVALMATTRRSGPLCDPIRTVSPTVTVDVGSWLVVIVFPPFGNPVSGSWPVWPVRKGSFVNVWRSSSAILWHNP